MNYFGQIWAGYPPTTPFRQLNIVKGDRVVFYKILHFLLLQKGEDPIHPEMGVAVPLFYPLTGDNAEWLVHSLRQDLTDWNKWAAIGLTSLEVETTDLTQFSSSLDIAIRYSTVSNGSTLLTFGLFEYNNARATGDVQGFLDAIAVNGIRLREWQKT